MSDNISHLEQDFSSLSGTIGVRSHHIRTLEDLLAYAETDLNLWEVERHVINRYEMGSKDDDGKPVTTPLYQIKAWLRRRKGVAETQEMFRELIEDARSHAPNYNKVVTLPVVKKSTRGGDRHLLEIAVPDAHIGKLCWDKEAGEDYDINIAKRVFKEAVERLVESASAFPVERILFPIGNDFFNVDNSKGTTTAGTPQDEDGRWQKSFTEGRKLLVETIDYLQSIAPVDVPIVPGNHDTERSYMLGEVLSAWYHRARRVNIFNQPTQRKYYQYGKCLLMFTHGNEEKQMNLPLIMATEKPEMWGETVHREVHVGHLHTKRETQFRGVGEYNGVVVRILPSLCAPDAWHKSRGYYSQRSAQAYLWNKSKGLVASLNHNV